MEVFGDAIATDADGRPTARYGCGVHAFRDPDLVEDFAAPTVPARRRAHPTPTRSTWTERRRGLPASTAPLVHLRRRSRPRYPVQLILGRLRLPRPRDRRAARGARGAADTGAGGRAGAGAAARPERGTPVRVGRRRWDSGRVLAARRRHAPVGSALIGTVLLGAALLAGCAALPARTAAPALHPAPAAAPPGARFGRRTGPTPDREPGYVRGTGVPVVVAHGRAGGHRIALTFDSNMTDACCAGWTTARSTRTRTPRIIDELEARHVPATFFLSGKWVEAYPELTRRLAADPSFELASHSWAHRGFPSPLLHAGHDPDRRHGGRRGAVLPSTRPVRRPPDALLPLPRRLLRPRGAAGGRPPRTDHRAIRRRRRRPFTTTRGHHRPCLGSAHAGAIVVLHITEANAQTTPTRCPG